MSRICKLILSGCILVLLCGSLPGLASAQMDAGQSGEEQPLTDRPASAQAVAGWVVEKQALAGQTGENQAVADQMDSVNVDSTQSHAVQAAKVSSAMDGSVIMPTSSVRNQEERQVVRTGVDLLTGNSGNTFRVHMSFGYEFTNRFSAGAGFGFVPYRDPGNLVPVFMDLVYLMSEGKATPYVQLKMGRSFLMSTGRKIDADRYGGGWIINPGVGLQIRTEEAQGLYITAGYNLDQSYLENDEFGNRVVRDSYTWRRMSIGFGFILP